MEQKEFEEKLNDELKEKKEKAFLLSLDPHATMSQLEEIYYPKEIN